MKTLLFKPFEEYPDKTLLVAGIVISLVGSFLGYLMNARFDGVLDLHFVKNVEFQKPFFDNLINLFSLIIFLFPLAKYLNKKTRLIDILIAAMVSRLPYYLMSLQNITGYMSEMGEKMMKVFNPKATDLEAVNPQKIMEMVYDNMVFLVISSILSILVFIWYIVLLYNGFKTASHAKGTKAVVLFIIAILLAEVLSKVLISMSY